MHMFWRPSCKAHAFSPQPSRPARAAEGSHQGANTRALTVRWSRSSSREECSTWRCRAVGWRRRCRRVAVSGAAVVGGVRLPARPPGADHEERSPVVRNTSIAGHQVMIVSEGQCAERRVTTAGTHRLQWSRPRRRCPSGHRDEEQQRDDLYAFPTAAGRSPRTEFCGW